MRTSGVIPSTMAIVIGCGGAWLAAQQSPAEQLPAFRTGVEAVSVEVGVVDRQGQPVRDLRPGDFTVSVDGQPRHVVTAEFVDASASTNMMAVPDPAAISTNDGAGVGRMVMFIVDQDTLDLGSARQVARSSSRFFAGLTAADRSALALLPVGAGVPFTWAHGRVEDALQRVIGMAGGRTSWEYGSLADARDIANANSMALRYLGQRECGGGSTSAAEAGSGGSGPGFSDPPASGQPSSPAPGGSAPGTGGGAPTPGPGGQTSAGSSRGGGSGSSSFAGFGTSNCMRNLQMQAESAWRMTQATSLSSIAALRQTLGDLARVRGEKTVILISGGWPLDERDETTLMAEVAAEAAAARATIFTIFVPTSAFSADRRVLTATSSRDHYIHVGPLETLAGMTGGGTFRAEVNADGAFDRLRRELGGYYRIGVEKDPSDAAGKNRRMKVQVSRGSVTVRARGVFDLRTYEDRDWAARLSSALDSPIPAAAIGLRVTSYITADPQDSSGVRIVLAGEASRLQPGDATFQVLVRDFQGRSILSAERPLGGAGRDPLPFSAEIPVPRGSYIVRLAVMDSAGRVGSVDHRVEARQVSLGPLTASRPLLIRIPADGGADPRVALDGVRQDERLALQVDLGGEGDRLTGAAVVFEVAAVADGPALIQANASLSHDSNDGAVRAQAVANLRVLPPGRYTVRARVTSGDDLLGDVRRSFTVIEAPRVLAAADAGSVPENNVRAAPRLSARGTIPPFSLDQVLAPPVLDAFLDRVSTRSDARSPAVVELLNRARGGRLGELEVSDAAVASAPVAAFLKGLSLLAQKKLDPAATAFRTAMNLSSDFYPAMVYLGACYAAGGRDKEASGAWRTALIKESDTVAVHILLADALLRQDRGDLALLQIEKARARWPDDTDLNRRFALAALLAGRYPDGLDAVERLVAAGVNDEPSLSLALLVLYEAFEKGRPIQDPDRDRARMIRLSEGYRAQGGPSMALVDAWLSAATRKQ